MSEQFSLEQAMIQLGCTRNTLKDWMNRCGIEGVQHKYNKRVRLITGEDIEALRGAMEEARRFIAPRGPKRPQRTAMPVAAPIPPPAPVTPPELRVTDARAMTRAQMKALTIEQKRALARPWPEGWHTVDALRNQYQLHPQVIENAELEGHFTIELGVWKKGNVYVLSGISAEEYPKFLAWIERHTAKFRGKRKRPDEVPPSLPLPE